MWIDRKQLLSVVSTFTGLTVALTIWVTLYMAASNSHNPLLIALAPHLEAHNVSGQCFFIVPAAIISLLTYRLLRPKADNRTSDHPDG